MIDPLKNQDTSLIHRKTEIKPSRNISQFLIGRPLQTVEMLRRELLSTPGVVITEVPYQTP